MIVTSNIFSDELFLAMEAAGYERDRLPGDILELPSSYYDIKIKVNDYVLAETINYSLEKIHNNWLYMISKSVIPSNNIPNMDYSNYMILDKGFVNNGTRTVNLNFYNKNTDEEVSTPRNFRNNSTPLTTNYNTTDGWRTKGGLFGEINQLTKVQNIADENNFNIIGTSDTKILMLSGSNTHSIDIIGNYYNVRNPIISYNNITHPSNEILFQDIVGHVITSNNELFVLDKYHKTIFKFDISGALTLDTAILRNDTPGRLMTGMIGGAGDVTDKIRFNNPIAIETESSAIYILDHTDNGSYIKKFDSDLNWKQTYNLTGSLNRGPLVLRYNDDTQMFYLLCHDYTYNNKNNINSTTEQAYAPAEMVIFDRDFNYVKTELLNDPKYNVIINTEEYRNIYFSLQNKNMMYVVTKQNIYKKYVTRPSRFIGKFLFEEKEIGSNRIPKDLKDITITPTQIPDPLNNDVLDKDEIMMLDSGGEVIHRFLEDSNFERSLQSQFDNKVLTFDDMKVISDEYVSTLTYNKLFTKHMYNNLLLLENTYRKFTTKFDNSGISQYIGFKYLNDDELDQVNYDIKLDHYIGNNELLLTETFNRCLNQILLLQENVLDKMQERSINKFPLIGVPVTLDSPYEVTEFVINIDSDGDGIPDSLDLDDDNDGLTDIQEEAGIAARANWSSSSGTVFTDPLVADTDGDGIEDADEVAAGTDPTHESTDLDSAIDSMDDFPFLTGPARDTDEDGDPDSTQIAGPHSSITTSEYNTLTAAQQNQFNYDTDDDNDLVDNTTDIDPLDHKVGRDGFGDSDGDGFNDDLDLDRDGDGYVRTDWEDLKQTAGYEEQVKSTEFPLSGTFDQDGNFTPTATDQFDQDPNKVDGQDFDSDGVDNLIDLDDDDDGLSDAREAQLGTDPLDTDTDDDSLTDFEEVENRPPTDPVNPDTDDDGTIDSLDQFPLDKAASLDTDSDGLPDELDLHPLTGNPDTELTEDLDDDNDGLLDDREAELGTDPKDADTDDDTFSDGLEVTRGTDPLVADITPAEGVNFNNIATIEINENTHGTTIYTIIPSEIVSDTSILNDNAFTIHSGRADDFEITKSGNNYLLSVKSPGLDFESIIPNFDLRVVIHFNETVTQDIIFKIRVQNVLEDFDQDNILEDVDLDDTSAQLQFITPTSASLTEIDYLHDPVIENQITTILDVAPLFENGVSFISNVAIDNTTDFTVDNTTIKLNAVDFETAIDDQYQVKVTVSGGVNPTDRIGDDRIINIVVPVTDDVTEDADQDDLQQQHDVAGDDTPQLQFISPSASLTEIEFDHAAVDEDNSSDINILDVTGLFENSNFISGISTTNQTDFSTTGNVLILKAGRDFETATDNQCVTTIKVSGGNSPGLNIGQVHLIDVTVPLNDVLGAGEDRDSDGVSDAIDETVNQPGMQFISPSGTETHILSTLNETQENNLDIQVADLTELFENPSFILGASLTNETDFGIENNIVTLSGDRDFETSQQYTTTIHVTGQDGHQNRVKSITITVPLTNDTTEDFDQDSVIESVDVDDTTAQLQFISPSGTETHVVSSLTSVFENNQNTQVINLTEFFENPTFILGSSITNETDFGIENNIVTLSGDRDFETSQHYTTTIHVTGQDNDSTRVKAITITVPLLDEDIKLTGQWNDDHTTRWEQIDTDWETLSGV